MWTQEYEDYINKSPVWQEKRGGALDRADDVCEFRLADGRTANGLPIMWRCPARAVHVHHLHYRNLFHERPEDLQALCELHHKVVHVWDRKTRCRCGRTVFDTLEDVIGFVEEDEHRDWDELYADIPTTCVRCLQASRKDDDLQRFPPANGSGTTGTAIHRTHQPEVNMAHNVLPNSNNNGANFETDVDDDDADDGGSDGDESTAVKIQWVRWPNMEQMITDNNVEWEYHKDVPVSEVNWDKSKKNLARIGPRIISDTFDSMLVQAQRYEIFSLPALVAWRDKDGRLVLNDGVHRLHFLMKVGITHADMYILVDPGPAAIETVTREANSMVGQGSNMEEKIRNGINYYRTHKCSYTEAARHSYIRTVSTLSQRIQAEDLAKRLTTDGDLPVPGSSRFNYTMICSLMKITNETVLQYAAIQLLTIPKFPHDNVNLVVKAIKAAKPGNKATQMLAVDAEVARQKEEMALDSGPARGPAGARRRVLRSLKRCYLLLEEELAQADIKDILSETVYRVEFFDSAKLIRNVLARAEKGLS